MKKRILSLLLALVMVLSVMTAAVMAKGVQTFADVKESDWFYDAVCYVTDNGLMNGTGRGFAPQQTTSRAMLWAVLSRVDGQNAKRNANDWYAAAQLWAIQHDISDGTAPEAPITREQLAAMLYRYAQRKGLVRAAAYADLSGFADAASVSAYADEALQWAVANGILTGMDGKLCPQGNATRAQVAQILYRLCEKWDLLPADNTAAIASAIYFAENPEHTHVWGEAKPNGNGTHTSTCACGETKTEYCGFPKETGTVTCPTCGFTTEHGVKNYEDLVQAIQAGGEVFVTDDIVAKGTIWIRKDTTIYGDGHTLTINDDGFTGKTLFENADGKNLTLGYIVIDGEKKERTNCLVLIKSNLAELTVLNSEIKNFNGTQIIALRERTGKLTVKDTTIHDNALKTYTATTDWGHGLHHNYYTEELAALIWVQKNDAVFENVSITKNTIDTSGEEDHKNCLGNGILIFFSGDNTGSTFYASNLIIEENEAPRHIFATYATLKKHTYTFESGHIGANTVNDPANAIFVVGDLTVGKDMTIECDIVFNNDKKGHVCTLTNNGLIVGDIKTVFQDRGLPNYTGSGTHTGTKTGLTVNP